jgi:hypothetical protein
MKKRAFDIEQMRILSGMGFDINKSEKVRVRRFLFPVYPYSQIYVTQENSTYELCPRISDNENDFLAFTADDILYLLEEHFKQNLNNDNTKYEISVIEGMEIASITINGDPFYCTVCLLTESTNGSDHEIKIKPIHKEKCSNQIDALYFLICWMYNKGLLKNLKKSNEKY